LSIVGRRLTQYGLRLFEAGIDQPVRDCDNQRTAALHGADTIPDCLGEEPGYGIESTHGRDSAASHADPNEFPMPIAPVLHLQSCGDA
jgi:hypothetical protein